MELPGPRIPQRLPDAVKDSGIIRLGPDAAQRPGVRWPKSMQGVMRLSTPQRASTSSSVPSWPIFPIVSGRG